MHKSNLCILCVIQKASNDVIHKFWHINDITLMISVSRFGNIISNVIITGGPVWWASLVGSLVARNAYDFL